MDSPPTPPSPPRYSSSYDTHKNKSSRRSPSTEHRSLRSSRNGSPRRSSRRRSDSRSPPPRSSRRSWSGERDSRSSRSSRHGRRDRSKSKSKGRSRSRDRNRRSRSRNRSRDHQRPRDSSRRHHRAPSYELDHRVEESSDSVDAATIVPVQSNAFKNDGSFMEMFKKMQEKMNQAEQPTSSVLEEKPIAPPPLMVGKRRGGRILKTGMVAKPKVEQVPEQPKDAWSLYMAEVKKYREVCCQEEDNTRPLVK